MRAGVAGKVITAEEEAQIRHAERLHDEVIRVDHFPPDFGRSHLIRDTA